MHKHNLIIKLTKVSKRVYRRNLNELRFAMNIEQEHKICILILIGLPGSGKTTFSSYLAHCLEDSKHVGDPPFDFLVQVCYDKIINSTENVPWNKARKKIVSTIDEMMGKLKKTKDPTLVVKEYNMDIIVNKGAISTSSPILIVIDDNMYYRSMRYQYYQIARTHHTSYCQLFLKCDVKTCLTRNFQREQDHIVPNDILLKMADNLEEPNACNFWEINSICINSDKPYSCTSLVPLYALLNATFSHPVKPVFENLDKEQSRFICTSNIIHQADLALRKIIGNTIRERKNGLDKKQMQELITNLNVKKHNLLQKLKLGELQLPKEIAEGTEASLEDIHSFFAKQII